MKALGQDVQQKAADELIGREGHELLAILVAIVFPGEAHRAVVDVAQAVIRDGDRAIGRAVQKCCGAAGGGAVGAGRGSSSRGLVVAQTLLVAIRR
jgi:hypothetical protein